MTDEAHAHFDALRLVADLRRGDQTAFEEAYQRTFGNEMGRLVLAHHLAECGVGNALGRHLTDAELRYAIGMHDSAINLAAKAGYDQAAIAVGVLSDNLEGKDNELGANYQGGAAGDGGYVWPDDDLDD